ncbi:Calcium-binding EF-hand family protein [Zostera marina]|uniref:Calcium-binding EF-hand family protein n=1 Tax=Zostera marina TaxID=29655 RepID=A0A0K9NPC4_ZOSMR|nr:Calcium-binding EF-hand family protein [Zostera marina]
METGAAVAMEFEDFLPVMAEKLGGDGLIEELCNGFRLVMDQEREVITFDSLKVNSKLLGLADMEDEELMEMMREGDLDGDGVLTQDEFCILMFRISPEIMDESWRLLDEAIMDMDMDVEDEF